MEAGVHGIPTGGCWHAAAVVHGLAAQPIACGMRVLPGQEPAAALAVGPEALLGRPAGCGPGVRRPRLAVLLWLPRRCAFQMLCQKLKNFPPPSIQYDY